MEKFWRRSEEERPLKEMDLTIDILLANNAIEREGSQEVLNVKENRDQ